MSEDELVRPPALTLLQEIAAAANEAPSIDAVMQYTVDRVCTYTGWPVGHVYLLPEGFTNELIPTKIWHLDDPERYEEFRKVTEATPLASGIGLPGRVLSNQEPAWITDISQDSNFPREMVAADNQVKAAFAFPVRVGSDIVAVLEFFSDKAEPRDEQLLDFMQYIGTHLGRVVERKRAEETLRAAAAEYRHLIESAKAIVWRGDAKTSQFHFVSMEAEKILGYPVKFWISQPTFWKDHIHPEDREWAVAYRSKASSEKKSHEFEYRMITSEDKVVWLRDTVHVVVENDEATDLIGIMIDVTKRKQTEMQLEKSREQLRALSAHLQYVREEERTKVAREVHDELGQVLTALKMELSLLNFKLMEASSVIPRKQLFEEIKGMTKMVDMSIRTVRRIVSELRPEVLDHLGLKAAIEWQGQEFQARTGIQLNFLSDLEVIEIEDPDCATAIFRIFQEALTNVARHSNASQVEVRLDEEEENLVLAIKDNGRGITEDELSKAQSFGILGMKERVMLLKGEVEIHGTPGKGTTVTLKIPMDALRKMKC